MAKNNETFFISFICRCCCFLTIGFTGNEVIDHMLIARQKRTFVFRHHFRRQTPPTLGLNRTERLSANACALHDVHQMWRYIY